MYEREVWTKFRTLEDLPEVAGVTPDKLARLVAKELADNALDATGYCRVGLLSGNGFFVEDNGDGIPGDDDRIASLFSVNRLLMSSKLLRRPTRGALGNGIRVVVGAVLASGGSLTLSTGGRTLRLIPQDETGATVAEWIGDFDGPGTRVEVRLGPALPIDNDTLGWARRAITVAAAAESSYDGRTSPHWYDSDAFYELLQSAKGRTVVDVIGDMDGCAHPKCGKIAGEFRNRPAKSLDRAEADRLLHMARESTKPVSLGRLGLVGPVVQGFPAHHAKMSGVTTRRAARGTLAAELPYVVEVWAELADKTGMSVYVNRTPITAEMDVFHSKNQLSIYGCGLDAPLPVIPVGQRPVRLCLNVQIPHMTIITSGKAPDLGPLSDAIFGAITRAVGRAKRHGPKTGTGEITQKDAILGCLDQAIARAGGGEYRFSTRQLYYPSRELVKQIYGCKEPTWEWFSQVITDYEDAIGHDIPGIYRDNRGTLYHPHTGEEIPLGTLNAEQYKRPEWAFNKILYCEKEGFFPLLKDTRWPERNDCALMTSKGFASRAARDVFDLLGGTADDEPITFYCIHDGDAPGTMIFQSLQEGTKARKARKFRIENLGLEPAEGLVMGLSPEPVERKKGKIPAVARYVKEKDAEDGTNWSEWLLTQRIELNAMTSPQILAWLDRKFAPFAGKVLPPAQVIKERLELDVHARLKAVITERILREADLDGQVEDAYEDLIPDVRQWVETIRAEVGAELSKNPGQLWSEPVKRAATAIVETADVWGTEPDPATEERR